jgi:phosphoribosylformimino-5-aminoimidazole carboxamide ribotide isomerase
MLGGPNLDALRMIAACGLTVIASGGIASLDHVREVAALEPLGVEAMIIGKALYEGRINLGEAIEAARSG